MVTPYDVNILVGAAVGSTAAVLGQPWWVAVLASAYGALLIELERLWRLP